MRFTDQVHPPPETSSGRLQRWWTQYRRRVDAEGFWRTLTYAVGTFMLAHLGLEVRLVYASHSGDVRPISADTSVEVVTALEQLSPIDLRVLEEFEGPELVEAFRQRFAQGSRVAVARDGMGALASACWVSAAPTHLLAKDERAVVIHDCFTVPAMRGRGLYPTVLRALRTQLLTDPSIGLGTVLVNCVFTNWASQSGIERAGFHREGTITRLGFVKIAHRRAPAQRILRRL